RETFRTILFPTQIGAKFVKGRIGLIPKTEMYYITIDIDCIEPSTAQATFTSSPVVLPYGEVNELLKVVAEHGDVIGFDLVEVAPQDDPTGMTGQTAARIMLDLLSYILKEKELNGAHGREHNQDRS